MSISLHIERLVLDGLPAHAGPPAGLQAALEAELTRLLAARGLPGVAAGALPELAAAPIRLSPRAGPRPWGRALARSLHASLAPAAAGIPAGPFRR